MQDIRMISLAVFATSFLIGFMIFQADKVQDGGKTGTLQLSMTPLFTTTNSVE